MAKMILSNAYNMRELFYNKILEQLTARPYGTMYANDFRVTELALSPFAFYLKRKFWNTPEYIIEASRCMNLLFGTAFHNLTEFEDTETKKSDVKVSVVLNVNGTTVTVYGSIDYWETDGICVKIVDWKTGKCSQINYPVNQNYVWQVNCYKYMDFIDHKFKEGVTPYCLYVSMFLKDHTQVGYRKKKNVPMIPFHETEVDTYDQNVIKQYFYEKISEKLMPIDETAFCSEEYKSFGKCDGFDLRCKGYCEMFTVCPYALAKGYVPNEILVDAKKRKNYIETEIT
jgi:hypothetical protein